LVLPDGPAARGAATSWLVYLFWLAWLLWFSRWSGLDSGVSVLLLARRGLTRTPASHTIVE
jgi:hypothetical protein